jgi:hypothetical protein
MGSAVDVPENTRVPVASSTAGPESVTVKAAPTTGCPADDVSAMPWMVPVRRPSPVTVPAEPDQGPASAAPAVSSSSARSFTPCGVAAAISSRVASTIPPAIVPGRSWRWCTAYPSAAWVRSSVAYRCRASAAARAGSSTWDSRWGASDAAGAATRAWTQ